MCTHSTALPLLHSNHHCSPLCDDQSQRRIRYWYSEMPRHWLLGLHYHLFFIYTQCKYKRKKIKHTIWAANLIAFQSQKLRTNNHFILPYTPSKYTCPLNSIRASISAAHICNVGRNVVLAQYLSGAKAQSYWSASYTCHHATRVWWNNNDYSYTIYTDEEQGWYIDGCTCDWRLATHSPRIMYDDCGWNSRDTIMQ